jgi:hypothetical protein
MKTTIDLPEEILRRAKVTAAQKKTTLKELVLSGLQIVLSPGFNERPLPDLADAFAHGRNTKPVGRLGRNKIYDRPVLRRH